MKMSVITVCLNARDAIAGTIESFLAQTHGDKELIVIDGGSQDGTVECIQAFGDPQIVLQSSSDRGLYDAMNKGLALYSGDAVGFLNADDRYYDEAVLADIARGLQAADVVSGHLDYVADHLEGKVVRRWRGTPYASGAFRRGWMPAHPTFYARRRVIDAVGHFDLSYQIAADYDYMLRAYEIHRFSAKHLDRVMVRMRAGGKSTAGISAHLRSNLESLVSRRRWLRSGLVDYALFMKPLCKLTQFASIKD